MFDPELLRSFVAVVDCGGFTAAGRRLHATQSTISGQLKRLEVQAGQILLRRSRRGLVAPTPAGEVLLGYAREILRLHEAARDRLAAAPLSGTVRLGLSDDFASGRGLTPLLAEFTQLHPDVELAVEVGNSAALVTGVAASALDYALAKQHAAGGAGELLARRAVVWTSGAPTTSLRDPVPLVLFPAPCAYRSLALEALRAAGRSWRIAYTSPSLNGLRSALEAGLGVAPLARDLVNGALRPVSSAVGLPALGAVDLVLHEGQSLGAAALRFGSLLRRAYGGHALDQSIG